MSLTIIVTSSFYIFFKSSLFSYLNLQSQATNFTDVAIQSQRISSVVRGLTGIISAGNNDLQIYAYFYPQDAFVSQVHYYLNGTSTQLLADVTAMTANPPTGTLITNSKKTYTIITNFKQGASTNLFQYLDASNTLLAVPVADLTAIKAIKINLAASAPANTNQMLTIQVSLRNRKTNL
jgi:hypothetical protein